jgi:hypothetical protein
LHFSPIHARKTFKREVWERIRLPEDLWAEQIIQLGGLVSPECRAYNTVS